MADLKLEFGLKKVGTEGDTNIVSTNAHWFMDSFWTTTGSYDSDDNCYYRPVIKITNPNDYPVHITSVKFSLINGSSGGVYFTDASGSSHVTYPSTATMKAYINNVASGSLQVGQGNSVFVKSDTPGYSYWQYRPSNSAGEPYPDGDGGSLVDRYTFKWSNPQKLAAGASTLVYFTATFNTSGSHLIQIYATGAMSSPVTHKVTFNFDGGSWKDKGSYSEFVNHGEGVSQVPSPKKTNYKFKAWKPNDTKYNNVTTDLTYTAVWEPDTAEVIFYRNKDSSDKVTLGKGSGTIGTTIGSGTDTINSAIKVSTGESLNTVVSENKSTALGLNELKGYTFYHWAKNNNYNKVSATQVPSYTDLSKVTIKADSSDNTFYAMWKAKSGTVTFYRNYDASDMTVVAGGTINNVSYATETVGSIKPENPTRPGYTFEGWSESRNGSVVANSLSLWNTSTDKARTKFYAIWSPITGPVTFYRNYDSSDMTVVDGGSKANVAYIKETLGSIKPSDPTRLGHKFIGWALTRTGGVESDNLSLWDVSANKPRTAFYAIWEKLYTVWVRVNGTWVKKLNVRRYRASSGTWEEIPPRTRSGGNWEDEWDDKS